MSPPPSADTHASATINPATLDLKIPPCPAILASFSAEARKDDPAMRGLATLIGNDAGLAAAILKTVNSPLFGLTRKAADIPQALAILGMRACTNLITGLLLRRAFPVGAGPLMARYWDESMHLAEAAIAVATRVRGVSRDQAHTYTLFRNCGMAVAITRFADYASIVEAHANAPGPELALTEEARYRFDHARVGLLTQNAHAHSFEQALEKRQGAHLNALARRRVRRRGRVVKRSVRGEAGAAILL